MSSRTVSLALALLAALLAALVWLPACGGSSAPERERDPQRRTFGDGYAGDATAAEPAGQTRQPPPGAARLVVLGDSLAAGLHLPARQAFPHRVEQALLAEGHAVDVVNAGVSGDTTAGGLTRLDWVLKQQPAIVVIELGGNDGLRGRAVSDVEADLRALVQGVRARGATPLLLGMLMPTSHGPDYTRAFREAYARVADELDVAFVPGFLDGVGGVPSMNLPDGIHPTPEGHERLAENVLPALRELVEEL